MDEIDELLDNLKTNLTDLRTISACQYQLTLKLQVLTKSLIAILSSEDKEEEQS